MVLTNDCCRGTKPSGTCLCHRTCRRGLRGHIGSPTCHQHSTQLWALRLREHSCTLGPPMVRPSWQPYWALDSDCETSWSSKKLSQANVLSKFQNGSAIPNCQWHKSNPSLTAQIRTRSQSRPRPRSRPRSPSRTRHAPSGRGGSPKAQMCMATFNLFDTRFDLCPGFPMARSPKSATHLSQVRGKVKWVALINKIIDIFPVGRQSL